MSWSVWLTLAVGVVLVFAWKRYAARLSPEETAQIREAVSNGAVLLDVRTPMEFGGGHLDGALNVPLNELMAGAGRLRKNRPVVVYCRSGARSGMAVSYLRRQGYTRAHNLRVMRNWAAISR